MKKNKKEEAVMSHAPVETQEELPIIEFSDVEMEFYMGTEKIDGLKEFFIKFIKGKIDRTKKKVLDGISFNVKKGESVAIIGHNGAGKSTTLKIITGILKPTMGSVKVRGNVAPLLNLGAGFDFEATAKENIYLNGDILGHSKKELEKKYNDIVEFSELHDYMNVPLKNFSSGMVARLGFAIAIDVDPDILLIDEVLAVGDENFRQKCAKKISELKEKGATFIVVSHSMGQIKQLCQRAIWIENSKLVADGPVDEICAKYEEYCRNNKH